MKITTKILAWGDPNASVGVSSFYVFYKQDLASFVYTDPFVPIPAVEGQTEYQITLPAAIPAITDGVWQIGVAAADAEGNISDIMSITRTYDFTAPLPVTNLRVL